MMAVLYHSSYVTGVDNHLEKHYKINWSMRHHSLQGTTWEHKVSEDYVQNFRIFHRKKKQS